MFKQKRLLVLITIIISILYYSPTNAQDEEPNGPYYIVQEGDSLWQISARFGVTVEDIMQENKISDASQLNVGAKLVIPGLKGMDGQLTTITVAYGDTLRSLSRYYHVSEKSLAQLNRLTSPTELYAGYSLVVPLKEDQNPFLVGRSNPTPGQSLLELAILRGKDSWEIVLDNNLPGTWAGLPGDVLRVDGNSQTASPSGLPEVVTKIEVDPLQLIQGGTTVIKVYAPPGITITGWLADRTLNFFPQDYGYVALQGVHAMTPPGLYPLVLEGELPNGGRFAFSQNVIIQDANFPYDPSLQVNPVTIDPAITEPEKELWESLGIPVTQEKFWNGQFSSPVPADFKECWTSLFGNRRSYNGGTYDFFHSGLDFCGQTGTELYASAPGKVVYTGGLTVRGGVAVIDHGWGIYTAYDHLSQTLVQPGDMVQPGQVIGLGGATGRTTGPHLHWEVWVGGVQVNPEAWLEKSYP